MSINKGTNSKVVRHHLEIIRLFVKDPITKLEVETMLPMYTAIQLIHRGVK